MMRAQGINNVSIATAQIPDIEICMRRKDTESYLKGENPGPNCWWHQLANQIFVGRWDAKNMAEQLTP